MLYFKNESNINTICVFIYSTSLFLNDIFFPFFKAQLNLVQPIQSGLNGNIIVVIILPKFQNFVKLWR